MGIALRGLSKTRRRGWCEGLELSEYAVDVGADTADRHERPWSVRRGQRRVGSGIYGVKGGQRRTLTEAHRQGVGVEPRGLTFNYSKEHLITIK